MKSIVLGSGPNGLAAAILLKKAGHEVTVLEAGEVVGGLAAGGAVMGGARHSGVLHDSHLVRPSALKALGISPKMRAEPEVYAPCGVAFGRATQLNRLVRKICGMVGGWMDSVPPDLREGAPVWPLLQQALRVRGLGKPAMMELLRIGAMPLQDYAVELWDDPQQQALAMPPALFGTWMGPRSPTTVATLLMHECLRGREVAGGPAALVEALIAAAPEVRTKAPVARVEVSGGRVRGVRLRSGEILPAGFVVSTLGPRTTLLDLISPRQLPPGLAWPVGNIRVRGIHAKLHLTLKEPLFQHERVRVATCPDELEKAYDDARHKRIPRRPTLDIRQVGDVASIWAYGATYELRGGWTPEAKQALVDAVLARLEEAAPGARDKVDAVEVLSPADLETRFGLPGGHVCHGELGLDQLYVMRPTSRLAGYSTGIDGLVLASDGMHPGAPLTLTPGVLAARRLLEPVT